MWEAQKGDGRAYLLGSIHFAQDDFYPLNAAIEDAFSNSGTLVVEVDVDDANPLELQKKMLAVGMYQDGRKLSDTLPPEALAKLKSFAAERGFPFVLLDSMKPWFASLMISVMELQRLGYDPEQGVDKHFLDLAKTRKMPVHPLETADFQIGLLSGFPDDLQNEFIEYTLEYLDRIPDDVAGMVSAWKSGDEAAMEELLLKAENEDKRYQEVFERIFYRRNADMANKIGALVDSGGTWFVVVGAGHLIGDRGVVSLLGQREGVKVSRVPAAAAVAQ